MALLCQLIFYQQEYKFIQIYLIILMIHFSKAQINKLGIIKKMTNKVLFDSIRNSENQTAKKLSASLFSIIDTLVDADNCTVLHACANSDNQDMAQFYLSAYEELMQKDPEAFTPQKKNKWLRSKDNEGFACLHYAVFRGNFKLAILLQQHGADIYQINHQGLSVLHIAAQGDSPLLMFYFLNKGLKIGGTDSKGSTPLHWACYSGQQNAAYSLISWGAQIDRQEFTYGMTPLHLAVMSGNGRIVRKLLLKGCDRNIKSYSGKLPLDIAQENQYNNIADMIIDKQGIQQLMNIKTPFRKLHRHTFPFYLLLFLFLSNYILNISFVLSKTMNDQTELGIVFLILGFMVTTLFVICTLSNPGYLKCQATFNEFQMLAKNKQQKICFDCKIVKPERSRHCQICNSCVSVYDHHCPWIANCVGARNYWAFFSFLVTLFIFMSYTIAFEIANLVWTEWDSITGLQVIRVICEIYSLITASLFIIPLIFLMAVQTRNCFQNKTTFQRFSAQKLFTNRNSDTSSVHKRNSANSRSQSQKIVDSPSFSISIEPSIGTSHNGQLNQKLIPTQNQSNCTNCYKMWCTNSKNMTYQMGA